MSERVELDAFHKHEAMDRAWMLMCMVDTWLADHPYVMTDPVLRKTAEDAIGTIFKIYQAIGAREL